MPVVLLLLTGDGALSLATPAPRGAAIVSQGRRANGIRGHIEPGISHDAPTRLSSPRRPSVRSPHATDRRGSKYRPSACSCR